MKAYQITENTHSDCAFVVFAEKASKARSIGESLFEHWYRYIDINAKRLPLLTSF